MRQFYLLAVMAAVCTVQVSAQSHATKLENNQVIYLTNDTVAFKTVTVEDEETGEQTTKVQETYWMGSNTNAAYKAVGLPVNGTSSTKLNLQFQTRNDYTDPETGFSMPAGFYRGILVDGTTSLQNYDAAEHYMVGYQNVKAVVLYLVPQPSHWNGTTWKPYFADYPAGRIQARYMRLPEKEGEDEKGVAVTNQAYREVHISMTKHETTVNDELIVDYTTNTCNFERDPEDYRKSTIDQVYKVKFNLDNQKAGSFYENLFASADKKSEFCNLELDVTGHEATIDYYFADVNTTRPFTDNEAFSSSATGYDCYANKWGVKVDWTPETIVQVEIKKRLYLAGYALICGTEGATTKFLNTAEGAQAAWSDDAKAKGSYGSSAIENVSLSESADARTYDLSGRAIQPTKGLQIRDRKLIFVK